MHYFNFTQFAVTVFLFYIEAVIHFNIGKKGRLGFNLPKWKDNKLILAVIVTFSFLSCLLTNMVESLLDHLNKSA